MEDVQHLLAFSYILAFSLWYSGALCYSHETFSEAKNSEGGRRQLCCRRNPKGFLAKLKDEWADLPALLPTESQGIFSEAKNSEGGRRNPTRLLAKLKSKI